LNNDRQLVNERYSRSKSNSDNYSLNGRFEFYRKLNSSGRNISLRANLGNSDGDTDSESLVKTYFHQYDSEGNLKLDSLITNRTTDRTSNNKNYSISASYTEPVFKNHYLQLRYEFSHRNSMAESLVYDIDSISDNNPLGFANRFSNKVENFSNTHSGEVSLRGIYPNKLMYNIGVGVTPQSSKSETTIGPNSGSPNKTQNVVNIAPSAMFRYNFNKQHVLTFRYRGRNNSPNISDLQEVIDQTDSLDISYGNPNLKPSFTNSFYLYYNNYIPETMRSYSLNLFFTNTVNSITNQLTYNQETGGSISRKVNVNGNWNTSAHFSFNTPLRNRKYTISSTTRSAFQNSVSYVNLNRGTEASLSKTRNLELRENLRGSYRSDLFDISLNASVNYNLTRNNKQSSRNLETFDYYFGGSTNINLPWEVYVSTDANYRIKEGYSGGFGKNELIWNAQISKNFLKGNSATLRFKIYDILQQQSNLTRSISDTRMTDSETNMLGSYFMVHFVYRINTLGGRSSRGGREGGRHERREGGPGGSYGGERRSYGPPPGGGYR